MLTLQLPTQTVAFKPTLPSNQSAVCSCPVSTWQLASTVQLDFSKLQSFEAVGSQFQPWGIEFENAIALQPSNSAFANPEHPIGLMPLAGLCLTIRFTALRHLLNANLAGSRGITVTAFDANHRLLSEQYLECSPMSRAVSGEPTIIHHLLNLQTEAIAKVEISSAAPFILYNFRCA